MPTKQITYKHHSMKGTKIVHTGIPNDLDRRETEDQSKPGQSKGHIKQMSHSTFRDADFRWEPDKNKQGKPLRKK